MGNTTGSIRKITLNAITFDVMADSNFNETGSAFDNDRIPTSGKSVKKMTKRVQKVESVVVKANPDERQLLKALSDSITDFGMSYTTADGSVRRSNGSIFFENRETEENRATLQLHPSGDWEEFVA